MSCRTRFSIRTSSILWSGLPPRRNDSGKRLRAYGQRDRKRSVDGRVREVLAAKGGSTVLFAILEFAQNVRKTLKDLEPLME